MQQSLTDVVNADQGNLYFENYKSKEPGQCLHLLLRGQMRIHSPLPKRETSVVKSLFMPFAVLRVVAIGLPFQIVQWFGPGDGIRLVEILALGDADPLVKFFQVRAVKVLSFGCAVSSGFGCGENG